MSVAVVTGASGFIGRRVVAALLAEGVFVRAGIRRPEAAAQLPQHERCLPVTLDLADATSLATALHGADELYHFAATVSSHVTARELRHVNTDGTRRLWEAAAHAGMRRALYCSSAAVYGLLSKNESPLTEDRLARAIEPYGRSKLLGERVACEVGDAHGLDTLVMRPTAVFGAGEHTHFGAEVKRAAVRRLLYGSEFRTRCFSYVHVDDVARAAVHLMRLESRASHTFNVAVEPPILYDEALEAYVGVLRDAGMRYMRQRAIARISAAVDRRPALAGWMHRRFGSRVMFSTWRPGFDMTVSSAALRATGFDFEWTDFAAILRSCLDA